MQLHPVKVHPSKALLKREDQLAWKMAAVASDKVPVQKDVAEMIINRVIDNASVAIDSNLPAAFTVVTRDLFADFGEFTLTGLALSPVDGEYALFDHIYLGASTESLDTVK